MKRIIGVLLALSVVIGCNGKTKNSNSPVPEAVDLGLPSGTLWATVNVGATSPEECGDYFEWGTITPDDKFADAKFDISGDSRYDAATANWGEKWRMPTRSEIQELINHCAWEWTTLNGVEGWKGTSKKNGNSIFLPTTGVCNNRNGTLSSLPGIVGSYWSSTPTDNGDGAYCFGFSDKYFCNGGSSLNALLAVRPVTD
jgi:hypothetical protein